MYVCIYVCMYIYICTYIYTYTHMHSFFWYSSLLITDSSKVGSHQSACTSKLLNFCSASKTNLRLSETGQAPQAWRAESHEMALRPLRKQLSETGLAVQLLQSVVGPCASEPSQKSQLPACANNRRASHTAQHPSRSTPICSYI